MTEALLLAGLFFAAALLYASVGHAGASAYLAAMALVGVAPETMRPTALASARSAMSCKRRSMVSTTEWPGCAEARSRPSAPRGFVRRRRRCGGTSTG